MSNQCQINFEAKTLQKPAKSDQSDQIAPFASPRASRGSNRRPRGSESASRGPQETSQISQIKVRSKSDQSQINFEAKTLQKPAKSDQSDQIAPSASPRESRGSNRRPEASRSSNWRPEASRGSNRRPEAQIGVPRHTGRVQSHGQTKARLKPTGFFCISLKGMVQTKDGAAANPWLVYMRACAAAYKAERAQQQEAAGASKAPLVESTPKRRTRKPKVTAHRHSAGVQSHGQGPGGAFSETTPEKSTGAGAPL